MKDLVGHVYSSSQSYSNPLARGLKVGRGERGIVYMPSAHDPKKLYRFRPIQIRLLHALSGGDSFEDVCRKLELTEARAIKLLNMKKCRRYLAELDSMDAEVAARGAQARVAREILDVWDGKVPKTREQMEAGKEWWARVWPRPDRQGGGSGDKIEININLGKVQEAFDRQQAIQAEIVPENP